MATTIHFIRHGSVEDPLDIYYGRLPGYPLSQLGRDEATQLAKRLKNYPITKIYTSPLQRTQETAKIISEQIDCQIVVDQRLIEVNASFEGQPRVDLHRKRTAADYGESMAEIFDRMSKFVNQVVVEHPDEQIVAVSHGGPIRLLVMGLESLPFTDYAYEEEGAPDYASDTVIRVDDKGATITKLNF